MDYILPKTENLTVTYNDITYSQEYYKTAVNITGVTDEAYSNWNSGTAYTVGQYAIIPELKRIFRSASANTNKYPLANPNDWEDYGNINSYNMFASDENIGSKTTGINGVIELDFSKSSAIAFIDLNFISMNVMLIYTDTINYLSDYNNGTSYSIDDAIVYEDTLYVSLVNSNLNNTPDVSPTQWEQRDDLVFTNENINGLYYGSSSYGEYFYTDAATVTRKIFTNLEWLPSSILRIRFDGAFSIGTICYDNIKSLGCTLEESRLSYKSTSKIQTNEFTGYRNVIRYGKIRMIDADIIYDNDLFNYTSQQIDKIVDKNIVWIPTSQDNFSDAISIGYIEDYSLPIGKHDKLKSTARIIGVSK